MPFKTFPKCMVETVQAVWKIMEIIRIYIGQQTDNHFLSNWQQSGTEQWHKEIRENVLY